MKKALTVTNCLLFGLCLILGTKNDAYGASPEESWSINCGASYDYTDPSENLWVKDESFLSLWRWGYDGDSNSASTTAYIEGTDLQDVYKTSRWGNMSYKVDMPNGTYKVTLMFAETHFDGPGQRVFDIALEGNTLWSNVDVFAWSGGKNRAMELKANVSVADACLDITFPVIYQDLPAICGIKIEVVDVSDDAFLDFIEKKMFWFFWNEASQATGLVKWGENNWAPGYAIVSSAASDGFALSIYTIGAERGWISEDDAYQRVMKMLNSFESFQSDPTRSMHGFWYHFIYMDDTVDHRAGDCVDNSEISTVDSALFVLGALQAGEYFRSTHSDVAAKAEQLYLNMDWGWFTNIGDSFQSRFINMGWKRSSDGYSYIIPSPREGEGGFYCNDWWNRYCESIFVDLLALGSPRPSRALEAWRDMARTWANAFGYDFINEPPLFTHQYHHLYFNLADKRDAYADYFLNTQKATLANRQTCLEDPESRYEQKRWGLTGCGGPPNGEYRPYGGYPGGGNDGTVAPTAAATSLMFTQDESMETIRYMFFKYKHMIWGLHGFCDSFNVRQEFRNETASALNNGAMIIGIENYRTGLVMNTFMNSPYANNALTAAGFAAAPQVSESSYENADLAGSFAYDGDPNTRWSSLWSNAPQWLEIDFKTTRTFNKIAINWEAAYARSYKIQVSNNRIKWTDIYSTNDGHGGAEEVILPNVTARYLRIYCTQRATGWGYSIWDITAADAPDYWILNMSEMGWYENTRPYNSTGAAVCQMILNYIRDGAGQPLLNQGDIYEYARGAEPYDGSELTPDQVDRALGRFDPYDYLVSNWADTYDSAVDGNPWQGYNYTVDAYDPDANGEAMNEYMRDICHWMAYTVTKENWWDDGDLTARPNTPAAVPVHGNYNHWVVIKGCVTNQNPSPSPHINPWDTPDFTVYGFWMKDPLVTGIGQDVYVTASECETNYFCPIDIRGDPYDGMLLQVAEPPKRQSTAHVEIQKPVSGAENLAVAAASAESINAIQKPALGKRDWRDLVDKNLLLDPQAVSSFEGTKMAKPVPVKRLDRDGMDYYIVLFNKNIRGELLTSAAIILDAQEGYFREASWTKNPVKMLELTRTGAIGMVRKKILKAGCRGIAKNIKDAEAELVWQPNSYSATPYDPFWKVAIGNDIWYVTQKGKVFRD